MQKWEYTVFLRSRSWGTPTRNTSYQSITDWNVDLSKKLEELGDQGWELVGVSPRSSYMGGEKNWSEHGNASALDYAGFTSDELWVFKRPKE